jgi:hypothetical protein
MRSRSSIQVVTTLFISIIILTFSTESFAGVGLGGYVTGKGLQVGTGILTINCKSDISAEKNDKINLVLFNAEREKFYYRGGNTVLVPEGVSVTPGDIVLLTGFNTEQDQRTLQGENKNKAPYVAVNFYKEPYVVVKRTKITEEGLYFIDKNKILRFAEPKKIVFILPALDFGKADKNAVIKLLEGLLLQINDIKIGCVDCKKSFVQISTQKMSVYEIEN